MTTDRRSQGSIRRGAVAIVFAALMVVSMPATAAIPTTHANDPGTAVPATDATPDGPDGQPAEQTGAQANRTADENVTASTPPRERSHGAYWPQFQFDTANTGTDPNGDGPTEGVTERWDPFPTGGAVSSPVVSDGIVFFGSEDGNVYAVDDDSGFRAWPKAFQAGGNVRTPAVDNGTVYVGTKSGGTGSVYALDVAGGTQQWSWSFPKGGASGAPTVADGVVYVPGGDDRLFAFDADTGAKKWQVFTGECFGGQVRTPAVVGDTVYITEDCGETWALDATTGGVHWKFDDGSGRGRGSPPTVANGVVYFGTARAGGNGETLFAVDAGTGTKEWEFSFTPAGDVSSSPAVADGRVFFGSANGNVYALDAANGSKIWEFSTGGAVSASPAVVDGVVSIASDDGYLYLLDAATGTEIDRFSTGGEPGSSPAVASGDIYVGSDDGNLYGLTGTGDNDSSDPAIGITVKDTPLVAGQGGLFYANLLDLDADDVSSFAWEFGDGTTATGRSVTHAYTTAGNYTVTLSVRTKDGKQFTTTRNVTVDPARDTFEIEEITPQIGDIALDDYTHVEGLDLNLSYVVTVTQPSSTANVTFELGNLTHTDADGSDGWRFPVPADQLTRNGTLTVTAYGTGGERAVDSRSVTVIGTPEWFDLLDPIQRFERRPIVELQGTFPAGDGSAVGLPNQFPFADDVSLPVVGSEQSSNVEVTVTVRINLRTTEAVVAVAGSTAYNVSDRVDVSGSVSGSASMHLYEMDLVGGTLTASGNARFEVPPTGIPNPPIGPVPPGVVRLYPIFGVDVNADAQFDEVDSVNGTNPVAFELTNGSIVPELYAKQELGQKLSFAELVFGLEEGVNTTVPLPALEPVYGNAFAQAYLRARAGPFTYRVSYPPGSDRFAYQFGPLFDSNAAGRFAGTPTRGSTPEVEWQPVSRTGPAPPGPSPSGGLAGPKADSTTPTVSPAAIAGTRITNNTVADDEPALASTGDGVTLVWSQQRADRSVFNGREVLASNATDGTNFASTTAVTDDNVSDYQPAIAAGDGSDSALAAFTTFDRRFNSSNATEPGDIYPYGEIRVARLNGSGWESPTYLTNDSAFDFGPAVVASGDNWTIAWTRDGDANLSTWRDREVAYVRYDESGRIGPIRTVEGARSPVLATIGGNVTRIGYLDMGSGEASGEIVLGEIQPGSSAPATLATYGVENLTGVAAANDTVAWTTGDAEPWMRVATTDGVRNLSAPAGLTPPQSVGLGARADRLLVTFRAARPDSSVAEAYYRPRVDGVWLPARQYASGTDRNLTYWQTATVGTGGGFTSVAAGKVLDTDQKNDLFGFRTQFRADLAVSVHERPENATVGSPANLTVAVRNTGDIPTNATTVAVSNGSGVAANGSVPALQPGESVNRSLTAVLDDSGTLTVEVDPGEEIQEHDETNNEATVRLLRPDLTVTDRTVTRVNGTIQVNATIANPSPIAAPAVTYRYSNGPTLNRSGTVGPLPPGATRQVSAEFTPAALSPEFPLTIGVDAAGALPESDETNNTLAGPIRKPDVRLSREQVNYYRQNGTIVASILVENAGTGAGEGTLRVSHAANGSRVASQPFDTGPALTTSSSTFTRTQIALPGVSENATVTVTASVRPRNGTAIVDSAATTDTVELNTTLLAPTGSLRLSRTPAVFNHTLLVAASASDDDGTVTGYDWTVTNGTIQGNATGIRKITPDNVSTLSVRVTVTDDDGLTRQLVRRVNVTQEGMPLVADYANEQGVVDTAGLLDAIDDWRADEVDTALLLDAIDAWRGGEPLV